MRVVRGDAWEVAIRLGVYSIVMTDVCDVRQKLRLDETLSP